MATAIAKTKCFICGKQARTFNCEGCSQNFCRIDLTKHFQLLSEQLDQIENNHDQFRQILLDQKQNSKKRPLIQEIDKWENDSIDKIKQTAEESRQKLINYTNKYFNELEKKLNNLAKQIKDIRQENDFNEIDLKQFKQKLIKLNEELHKPSNVSIEQQSTSFIDKISVIIRFSKSN